MKASRAFKLGDIGNGVSHRVIQLSSSGESPLAGKFIAIAIGLY
jgi:hypothetical protein